MEADRAPVKSFDERLKNRHGRHLRRVDVRDIQGGRTRQDHRGHVGRLIESHETVSPFALWIFRPLPRPGRLSLTAQNDLTPSESGRHGSQ